MRIFISHSSKDLAAVKALVQLIRDALQIAPGDIRCSSLDGYRLPAAARINEQLLREIKEAEAFIAFISYQSIRSLYVTFELGARWGTGKNLIPLRAPGFPASELEAPLSALNSLSSENGAQLHQLVADLARELDLPLNPAAVYHAALTGMLALPPGTGKLYLPKRLLAQFELDPIARKQSLSSSQQEMLNYLEEQSRWRVSVPQRDIEEKFRGKYKEVYWRLESLRLLGFTEKEVTGEHAGITTFNYRLSEEYRSWLPGT